jgi:hypothetical protein
MDSVRATLPAAALDGLTSEPHTAQVAPIRRVM